MAVNEMGVNRCNNRSEKTVRLHYPVTCEQKAQSVQRVVRRICGAPRFPGKLRKVLFGKADDGVVAPSVTTQLGVDPVLCDRQIRIKNMSDLNARHTCLFTSARKESTRKRRDRAHFESVINPKLRRNKGKKGSLRYFAKRSLVAV